MGLMRRLFGRDKQWRKIYDPLISRYAVLAGAHFRLAELEGRECPPLVPLAVLLKEVQPALTDDEIEQFLESCKLQFDSFEIADLLTEIMQEANVPLEMIPGRLEEARSTMLGEKNYNAYLVRLVIGEVIGYNLEAGPEERKRYWTALLSGNVV